MSSSIGSFSPSVPLVIRQWFDSRRSLSRGSSQISETRAAAVVAPAHPSAVTSILSF
jgi:hypothetical protein